NGEGLLGGGGRRPPGADTRRQLGGASGRWTGDCGQWTVERIVRRPRGDARRRAGGGGARRVGAGQEGVGA
ncbi:hypothetical protein, partial [Streptomyces sp. CC77]|uniref:hypothetical protein n=1 Tax=Streptomyces sp. CC77 TaxID=1906739 RepID=UPI001C31272F